MMCERLSATAWDGSRGPQRPERNLLEKLFSPPFCFAEWINGRYLPENIKDSFKNSEKISWHGRSVEKEVVGKVTTLL